MTANHEVEGTIVFVILAHRWVKLIATISCTVSFFLQRKLAVNFLLEAGFHVLLLVELLLEAVIIIHLNILSVDVIRSSLQI